ncbi:MAG: glycosyl hydrolase family 28-related protein, partial [Methylophagaceae bacterium]
MAVIQISRVQHRRGLLQDLPQLSAAELGWVIDNRKLYIGNGPVEEGAPIIGNTEILTQYSDILGGISSYTYKGTEVGYIAQTQSGSGNVQRTLQSKLDDFVSAKDFGIIGDGTTDVATKINWMLFQIYCREATNTKSLKRIFFPAGTYIVKSPIKIPDGCVIVGEGAENTIFKYTGSTADYVARTADSAQQTGTNIG